MCVRACVRACGMGGGGWAGLGWGWGGVGVVVGGRMPVSSHMKIRTTLTQYDDISHLMLEFRFVSITYISGYFSLISYELTGVFRLLYRRPGHVFSLSGKMSYHLVSWGLEVARLDVVMIVSLWYLRGVSTTPMPRYLSNSRVIGKV